MRKNRNAFFAENNMNYQGYNPMMGSAAYQNATSSNSFYSGPVMPNQMLQNQVMGYDDTAERIAKIERQINRLEHRISKLEANSTISTDDYDSTTNNMYIL